MCDNTVHSSASYILLSESKKLVINLKSKYKEESQSCTHLGSSLGESEAKISNIYREGASSSPPSTLGPEYYEYYRPKHHDYDTTLHQGGGAYTYGTIQYIEIILFRTRIDYFRDPYPERVPGFSRRKEY
jgi:hypothetical protein